MLFAYIKRLIRWPRTGYSSSVSGVVTVPAASKNFLSKYWVLAFGLFESVRLSGSDDSLLRRSSKTMTILQIAKEIR